MAPPPSWKCTVDAAQSGKKSRRCRLSSVENTWLNFRGEEWTGEKGILFEYFRTKQSREISIHDSWNSCKNKNFRFANAALNFIVVRLWRLVGLNKMWRTNNFAR